MELFTQGVTSDTAAAVYGSILLAWAVWVWVNGLIGIFRAKSIRRTYGSLLDGAWAFVRLLRSWLTAAMLAVIVGNALQRMAGVKTELLISNVVGVVLVILLNWLVITGDKKRFYGRCDRALAKKIIRAERQMAYSILTRISLIFTILPWGAFLSLRIPRSITREKTGISTGCGTPCPWEDECYGRCVSAVFCHKKSLVGSSHLVRVFRGVPWPQFAQVPYSGSAGDLCLPAAGSGFCCGCGV